MMAKQNIDYIVTPTISFPVDRRSRITHTLLGDPKTHKTYTWTCCGSPRPSCGTQNGENVYNCATCGHLRCVDKAYLSGCKWSCDE